MVVERPSRLTTIPAGDSAFSLYGVLPGRPHLSTPYASLMERDIDLVRDILEQVAKDTDPAGWVELDFPNRSRV